MVDTKVAVNATIPTVNTPAPTPTIQNTTPDTLIKSPTAPTVSIYGCGGFGITSVRRAITALSDRAVIKYIDTSRASILPGEDLIVISTGDGSGKVRVENAEAIQKEVAKFSTDELGLSDVNILVFSLSGGTGSVLGPVWAREISRRKNVDGNPYQVVALVVADTLSEIDSKNTLNTLKTLQAIASKNSIYLPIMFFSNDIKGRSAVNISLPHRLVNLVNLLTLDTQEVDRNDRRNWLNPSKTVAASPGLHPLHVVCNAVADDSDNSGEIWEYPKDHIYDSLLSIGVIMDTDPEPVVVDKPIRARFRKDGVFTSIRLTPMLGIILGDDAIVNVLIKDIQDSLAQFDSQTKNRKSTVVIAPDEIGDDGLVF